MATAEKAQPAPAEPATILITDDQPENLAVLAGLLQGKYRVRAARSGEIALRLALDAPQPELILLDIMMPGMDGYTVLEKLRQDPKTRGIPVIFVTALGSEDDEQRGLDLGAVDYITKPLKPAVVLARVQTHLNLKAAQDALARHGAELERLVALRTQALHRALEESQTAHARLKKTHFATLTALAQITALRDENLGNHARRVADLSRQVAQRMQLSEGEVQSVFIGALLHDVGKIGFSDQLLGRIITTLRGDDLALYRRHPARGADALSNLEGMETVADIVRHHHENYDGSGFPDGLTALNIPVGARIVAAVSDYDGLRRGNLTEQPMTAKQTFQYLMEEQGSRYDPLVIRELEQILRAEEDFEIDEMVVTIRHLQEGMTLSRDILHPKGFVLLSKGAVLTRFLIQQLLEVQATSPAPLRVFVHRQWTPPEPEVSVEIPPT
ncbi:MAG: HD domain-containing phosphohydrolase [Pseudomonadota bacterium]